MIISAIARAIIGPALDQVFGLIRDYQAKKLSEAELREKLAEAVMDSAAKIARQQAGVIEAEARGESWLQRNWRPMVAVSFAGVLLFYAIVLPIAVDWFGAPPVRVGDQLLGWIMQTVMIALGGYIGGRTIEKVARIWKR